MKGCVRSCLADGLLPGSLCRHSLMKKRNSSLLEKKTVILVSQKPHYGSGFSVMRGMVKALRNQESKILHVSMRPYDKRPHRSRRCSGGQIRFEGFRLLFRSPVASSFKQKKQGLCIVKPGSWL
ncbi:hypothetical protein XENTR_v10020259 [Xenopus tropicalis]|nr:hypothetical protein XENTR_v10020259 [Xenopus tropicalis]